MLEQFVITNREAIIAACLIKVAKRSGPSAPDATLAHGVPMFLDQLAEELHLGLSGNQDINQTARRNGIDLLQQGFTVSQVVHCYGDVCQAVTEMALAQHAPISADDFRMLNRCLDDAIASAVTEYGREHDRAASGEGERLRTLANGILASVMAVRAGYQALKDGQVGYAGSTGKALDKSLEGLAERTDRLRAEIDAMKRPLPATS